MPHVIYPVQSGAVVNEDTAISWSAIWRGLQLVGSAIGSMPFTIQEGDENGNVTERKDHPLYKMISMEPHPFYSTFDFLQAIIFQVLLRGNAVIVINRGGLLGANRPLSLRLVEYNDVTDIREDWDNETIYYTIKGFDFPISHLDIIHVKGLTKNGLSGLDALSWNRETFGLALATKKSASAYYRNGTHSEGFLSTDAQIKPETRKDVEAAWRDKNRTGETPFLTGGVKWNTISVAPKDIQLLEGRQFNVYEAARILGISPHLLFAMDRANFSNVETLSLEFAKYTLRFLVERIEQEFNRKIFRGSEIGRLKVNLNMDAFLRGDTDARTKYLEGLIDRGVLSIDEARKIEGFNALADKKGKTHMVPLNFQTLDNMVDPKEPEPDQKAANGRKSALNGHAKILN
jgi:HK97 family phage portal protein